MKKPSKNIWKPIVSALILIFGVLLVIDLLIMPFYVSGSEAKIPNVVGMNKDEAFNILEDANLSPVIQTTRYDEKYGKDRVNVKISIGPQLGMVRVPNLVGRSFTEVENTLKSLSLRIGTKIYVKSSGYLPNTIIDHTPAEGSLIKVGDSVNVWITGSKIGDR